MDNLCKLVGGRSKREDCDRRYEDYLLEPPTCESQPLTLCRCHTTQHKTTTSRPRQEDLPKLKGPLVSLIDWSNAYPDCPMLGAAMAIADVFNAFSALVAEDLQRPFLRDLDSFITLAEVIQYDDGPAQVQELGNATVALLVSYVQLCQRHNSSRIVPDWTGQDPSKRDQDTAEADQYSSDEDSIGVLSDDASDMEALKSDVIDEYGIEAAEQDAYEMLSNDDVRYAMEAAGQDESQLSADDIGMLSNDAYEKEGQNIREAIDQHTSGAADEVFLDDDIDVLSDNANEVKLPAYYASPLIQSSDIEPRIHPASSTETENIALSNRVRKIIAMLDSAEGLKVFSPEERDRFANRLKAIEADLGSDDQLLQLQDVFARIMESLGQLRYRHEIEQAVNHVLEDLRPKSNQEVACEVSHKKNKGNLRQPVAGKVSGNLAAKYADILVDNFPNCGKHLLGIKVELGRYASFAVLGDKLQFTPRDGREYRIIIGYLKRIETSEPELRYTVCLDEGVRASGDTSEESDTSGTSDGWELVNLVMEPTNFTYAQKGAKSQ